MAGQDTEALRASPLTITMRGVLAACLFGVGQLACIENLAAQQSPPQEQTVEIGRLRSAVNLPLYFQGKQVGSMVASAGTQIDVLGEQDGGLKIAFSGNSFLVGSDLVERGGQRRLVNRLERLETKPDRRANFEKSAPTSPGLPTGRENFAPTHPNAEREVLRLTNVERGKAGLPPLAWDENLARAARYHAADMAHDAYFDHDSFDRKDERLVRLGVEFARIRRFDRKGSAENIALMATSSAAEVISRWMESPHHRENILSRSSTRVGIGFCAGYWVQDFGW